MQFFLNDNPEGTPLIHKVPPFKLGVFEQIRDRLESRVIAEIDVLGQKHPRKVLGGPSSLCLLRLLGRLL